VPSGLTASSGKRASAARRAIAAAAPSLEGGDEEQEAAAAAAALEEQAEAELSRSTKRNCSARDQTPKKGIEATCLLAAQQGWSKLTTARPSR
jgi:hypothetical protein